MTERTQRTLTKLASGALGGQSRAATPVWRQKRKKRPPVVEIPISVAINFDNDTTGHSASLPTPGLVGSRMFCWLAVQGNDFGTTTDTGSPAWVLGLSSLVHWPATPFKYVEEWSRTRTSSGNQLAWSWSADVSAAAIVVEIEQAGLAIGDSNFSGTPSTGSIGTSYSEPVTTNGVGVLVFVWSSLGAAVSGARQLFQSTNLDWPANEPSGFGKLTVAFYDGSGLHNVTATATNGGVLRFVQWIEVE